MQPQPLSVFAEPRAAREDHVNVNHKAVTSSVTLIQPPKHQPHLNRTRFNCQSTIETNGQHFLPVLYWLLQVVTLRKAVPEQVVSGALGGGVVVDGGMREKRTGEPTDLPLQNRHRPLSGLAPVITREV